MRAKRGAISSHRSLRPARWLALAASLLAPPPVGAQPEILTLCMRRLALTRPAVMIPSVLSARLDESGAVSRASSTELWDEPGALGQGRLLRTRPVAALFCAA